MLNESTLQELQGYSRFRHLVRNLYADELPVEPIKHLIQQIQYTWPKLETDIIGCQCWLKSIARESARQHPQRSDNDFSQKG